VTLEADEIEPMIHRRKVCLIGKLMVERIVPKEYFRVPLLKIWRPVGTVSFQVIGGNIFIAEFEEEGDKIKVMEGRPWIFYSNSISLAEFDIFRTCRLLGPYVQLAIGMHGESGRTEDRGIGRSNRGSRCAR